MNVYFDNAATTPLNPLVLEKMLPYLKNDFGNPSSIHSFGRKIRVVVEESREVVADFINADPSEIYFTSGGTESINFAINGIARTEFNESGKNELISSPTEHSAVLDTNKSLELSGFKYIELNVERNSSVNLDSLSESLTDKTSLVSIMYTNNETGAINNVSEIANKVKNNNSYFHCDAVQAIGKIRINVNELKVDALSASAHKIYGPKGIGFLYVRSGTPISPLLIGGSQERNRRAGTENVAGIIGLAETFRFADAKLEENEKSVLKLKTAFIDGLNLFNKDEVEINGGENTSPHILSMTFNSNYFHNDSEGMLMLLDINGVAASQGSACASGTLKTSHVILSTGKSKEDADGTIRFSFNPWNTIEEVEYTLGVLEKLRNKFLK